MNFQAVSRNKLSMPLRHMLESDIPVKSPVLDYGCGHGKDVEHLQNQGFTAIGYDPHTGNFKTINPHRTFKTILLTYVLTVIPDKATRIQAIQAAWGKLREDGWLIITVRSNKAVESSRTEHWKSYKKGYLTKKGTYQMGFDNQGLWGLVAEALNLTRFPTMKSKHHRDYEMLCVQKNEFSLKG